MEETIFSGILNRISVGLLKVEVTFIALETSQLFWCVPFRSFRSSLFLNSSDRASQYN